LQLLVRRRQAVDISDAAAEVGYFLLSGDAKFDAPCDDACDANDDGRLDAATSLPPQLPLHAEEREDPAPGVTTPGKDPTTDKLGCKGGQGAGVDSCD
jgi:hypothetical protein